MGDRTAVIAVSPRGAVIGRLISEELDGDLYILDKYAGDFACVSFTGLSDLTGEIFTSFRNIVFVAAQGIAARVCAPHVKSKLTDPAVVVCDDSGRFAISYLSGHEGGANVLAYKVASITGAFPVVTTATESSKSYVLGIGTRKRVDASDVQKAVQMAADAAGIKTSEIRALATAWIKKGEEGISLASDGMGIPVWYIPEHIFRAYNHIGEKTAAAKYFDLPAVAEPSAMIAGLNPQLVLASAVYNNIMVAVSKDTLFPF